MTKLESGRERGRKLVEMIYEERARHDAPRHPNSLRPSELGHECTRYLWYRFRWSSELETFDGRMLRLFETGQLAESRFVDELRSIGSTVWDTDPENATKQIGIKAFNGHSNGFLDGVAGEVPLAVADYLTVEFKTHSEKSFKLLEKEGVEASKPQHYAQMQLYMHEQNLKEALYMAVNKNNDQLYCEFLPYNERYLAGLQKKASVVIYQQDIPQRMSEQPTFYKCKFCSSSKVCHERERPTRSCRTCAYSHAITPKEQVDKGVTWGAWVCELHDKVLDLDDQRSGCADHLYHPHLVTGDSANSGSPVTENGITYPEYTLDDGTVWVDRGPSGDREHP